MTLDNFEEEISPAILGRAQDYIDAVDLQFPIDNGEYQQWRAQVRGSDQYSVVLQVHKTTRKVLYHSCSCPFDGLICKHKAAVLYVVAENASILAVKAKKHKDKLQLILDQLSPEELKYYIVGLVQSNGAIRKDFIATEEEIKAIVQEGTQGGEILEIEQSIVERVFMLGDRKIRTLMTPRSEIVYMHINADLDAVRQAVGKDLHRIYPVFEKNSDNVVGVASLKDLFLASHFEDFRLQEYTRPAHYLPDTTSAYKALEKFKASRVHYALVIDEYGSIVGMITLYDILQALVGDASQFHQEEYEISRLDDGSWIIDGQYPFSEFLFHFGITNVENQDEIITVAGLILDIIRDIPKVGEVMEWKGLILEVLEMENARIRKVLVKLKHR